MEETGIIGIKFIMFCAIFLQIADASQASNIFDYLDTFGTVAILIFGIRYFIGELKARDTKHKETIEQIKAEYLQRWKDQEARHNDLIKQKDATTAELLETQRQIFLSKPE